MRACKTAGRKGGVKGVVLGNLDQLGKRDNLWIVQSILSYLGHANRAAHHGSCHRKWQRILRLFGGGWDRGKALCFLECLDPDLGNLMGVDVVIAH